MKDNEYLAMFKMKLIEGFQYRAAALAGIATQFFFGFMFLMIYYAFYQGSAEAQPMTFAELASYNWLRQAFLAAFVMWSQDNELLESITSGHVAYEFCRPYRLYELWYSRLMAQRLAAVLMRCLPIIAIASLLPAPWRLNPPDSALSLFLFIISISLGVLIATGVSMFVYIFTFLTMSPSGVRLVIVTMTEFLSGSILPAPLMPPMLQKVLYALPFVYTADMPFRVYSGHIAPREAFMNIGVQILWVVILFAVGKWCFYKIARRVVIQGG
ncbi:MAG: ABC-2 family transporter protein [Oscillospiraceae bacterium]|jgi:ABC-2 type transport system permease protein|nr:ABC-2 family transporter protein [Oscillospiraceae bacterium]